MTKILERKRAKALESTAASNCLTCTKFMLCKDKRKAFNFKCAEFKGREKSTFSLDDFDKIKPSGIIKPAKKELLTSGPKLKKPKRQTKEEIEREYGEDGIEEEGFNLEKLIKGLVKDNAENGHVIRDLRVDDRDVKEARNFLHFVQDYLGLEPWAKQVEIGANLFSEICWNPRCTDTRYARSIPTHDKVDDILERVTMLEHGKCPNCGSTKHDWWQKGSQKNYNELVGLAGQRSSKSKFTAIASAYVTHRYLKLQNPTKVLGLIPSETLSGTFIAVTYAQARDNLWSPFQSTIEDSWWFQEYHKILKHYGHKYGEELYKARDTFLQYSHRSLLLFPASSSKRSLRGYTRFLGAIDEIGWIGAKNEKSASMMNPDEIHGAMKRSFLTVNSAVRRLHEKGTYQIPGGLLSSVSSPSSKQDKICRLYDDSRNSRTTYGFHYSVFDMNPTITEEDLEDEYRNDPVGYKRDYLAIPPRASNPFFPDAKVVRSGVDPRHKNPIIIKQKDEETASGLIITSAKTKFLWKDSSVPRLLALDAGEKDNSFAGCVMSLTDDGPSIDGLFEVVPQPEKPVNFTYIYEEVIEPIIKAMNVKYVCADRWNSTKILQDIEYEFEIGWGVYSVKYPDFTAVRTAMVNAEIRFPRAEMKIKEAMKMSAKQYPHCFIGKPVSHLLVQALTVEEVMGKTVMKGEKKTDDLFRAFVLAYSRIMDEEVQFNWLYAENGKKRSHDISRLGAVTSYSMGGMKQSNSNIGAVGSRGAGVGASTSRVFTTR